MAYLPRSQILKAIDGAIRTRLRAGYEAQDPVCVYDLADKLGVEVRFVGGNSFGGMYVKDFDKILVPTMRPPGRKAYTCAHELGHWHFRHGTRIEQIEELDKGGFTDPDERMADIFACHLLMPQWALEDAIRRRSLTPARCQPIDCYRIANQLGIGYTTVIRQLERLRLISSESAIVLLRTTPKQIRETVLGTSNPPHLVIVDPYWRRVAIDLCVGDALVIPRGAQAEGKVLRTVGLTGHGIWLEASFPGVTRVVAPDLGWSSYVRVARREYVGRNKFRFLEDPDVEPTA